MANFIYFYRGVYRGLVRKSCLGDRQSGPVYQAGHATSDIGQLGSAIYGGLVSPSSALLYAHCRPTESRYKGISLHRDRFPPLPFAPEIGLSLGLLLSCWTDRSINFIFSTFERNGIPHFTFWQRCIFTVRLLPLECKRVEKSVEWKWQ